MFGAERAAVYQKIEEVLSEVSLLLVERYLKAFSAVLGLRIMSVKVGDRNGTQFALAGISMRI